MSIKKEKDALTSVPQLAGCCPQSERSQAEFLVRAHAWVVAGPWSGYVREASNRLTFLSHLNVCLPLFLLPLPKNK